MSIQTFQSLSSPIGPVGRLKFIDSFQFTPQRLDGLAKTLAYDEFKYVRQSFPAHQFDLIKRKGVHPYDYLDSFARLDESRLPSQDAFCNKLSDSSCSDGEYAHATRVWTVFGCESMADYHDIYLKCDVLLLADFFEKFRATCLEHYGLDAVHYYTTPGLACDAALRVPCVSLELNTDVDMYHFVDNSIRGGITTCYARVNVPTLPAYDATLPNLNLIYLDANNLYGWAMSQPLATHGFRFLQQYEIEALGELSDEAEDGYIFDVDLSYPHHLHDSHDDYPLAPESLEIGRDVYSPAQRALFPDTALQRKLTPNWRDKVTYVVHYRNLKLFLQLCLVVTKIHRVLTFKQSSWLKTYIDFNTRQRSLAGSSFLKDFFKLMNSSVFGKTQENLRKRVNVELITDVGVLRKRVAKPNFCRGNPITDCLTVVQCNVATLTLDRPIYVGFSVLEFSKLHDFQYHHMRVKYPRPGHFRLLFTDTDSWHLRSRQMISIEIWQRILQTITISASILSTIPSIVQRIARRLDSSRTN